MCDQFSESGQPCGFVPCEEYKRVRKYSTGLHDFIEWLSQRHPHDGLSKHQIIHMANQLLVGGKWRDDHVEYDGRTALEVAEAENAALRQERDALAHAISIFSVKAGAKIDKAADIMESALSENGFDPDLGLLNALEVGGKARQELNTLQVCYKAAESSRRLAIVELNALRAVIEKADALVQQMLPECEACGEPCESYALARLYQEARHG